jgi:Fe-S cluster assembly protein SufD
MLSTEVPSSRSEFWRYSAIERYLKVQHESMLHEIVPKTLTLPADIESLISEFEHRIVFYNGLKVTGLTTWNGGSVMAEPRHTSLVIPAPTNTIEKDHFEHGQAGLQVHLGANQDLKLAAIFLYGNSLASATVPRRYRPRHSFALAAKASCEVFEIHVALNDIEFSINQAVDVDVQGEAQLYRTTAYWLGSKGWNFNSERARVYGEGQYQNSVLSFGGAWTRLQSQCDLLAKGAKHEHFGLYIQNLKSQFDMTSLIRHVSPETMSHQMVRGILKDEARAAFNGKIVIEAGAQKSESAQLNQAIVLSSGAEAISRPQLEVLADDVKAFHGATMGQDHDLELFYLRSRGLDRQEAERMLLFGFGEHVVNSISKIDSRQAARTLCRRGTE